jgi:hypothetical protein
MPSATLGDASAVLVRYRVSAPLNVTPILKGALFSVVAVGAARTLFCVSFHWRFWHSNLPGYKSSKAQSLESNHFGLFESDGQIHSVHENGDKRKSVI